MQRKRSNIPYRRHTHISPKYHLDVNELMVDLITLSAHTIHGPTELGHYTFEKGTPLMKWLDGGFPGIQ